MDLRRVSLILKLLSLGLPPDDYVVAGSGPLLAHGLRDEIGDLDLVARGAAWKAVSTMAVPVAAPSGHGRMVVLADGQIEVFDRWLPGTGDPGRLIESAERVQGIPFCPLREVLGWKERSDRPKDRADVELIKDYLSRADTSSRDA
ncbi:hypothetical protein GCM10011583_27220 [Streptomyces camponoticapitis]|uniref:Uncharacterized protein n=1 Tax=Streptomyces camponoticapitis TaxID=1616125 RepID=A0ABQ2E418_9ACTN|nr:hypothetical protein [Streptomyces camponoticapitis]GGJ94302.1 hypothetical protein GCM10011583_27220 [Streptomyces camponoticapitis]